MVAYFVNTVITKYVGVSIRKIYILNISDIRLHTERGERKWSHKFKAMRFLTRHFYFSI